MTGTRLAARAVTALLMLPPLQADAQTAILSGAVVRDTLSHGLSGATVAIPALDRSATSDAKGEFKLSGLPAGRQAVLVRRIGFNSLVDTVTLVDGQDSDREYVLDPTPTVLDSVRIDAAKEAPHLTAQMSEFEDHRKFGFGHYITSAELRKNDTRKLNDLLTSTIPSLSTYRPYPRDRPSAEYLSSGRGQVNLRNGAHCPVSLYVNGVLYFGGNGGAEIPDIAQFPTAEIEAVEYYAGGNQVPQQYNATQSGCGVLVLWMRDR